MNTLDYFIWSYVENITNMTSNNTKTSLVTAIHRVIAELSPALVEKGAPSSRSVSRRWLRLKAATLNRCQLYYMIKLPELIFSIKVLKKSCSVVFFRTIILSFHSIYIYIYIYIYIEQTNINNSSNIELVHYSAKEEYRWLWQWPKMVKSTCGGLHEKKLGKFLKKWQQSKIWYPDR